MVDIRRAGPADANAVARIHVAVWQSVYRGVLPDDLLDQISVEQRQAMWSDILIAYAATHPVLVAEDFGVGICGFGNIGPLRDDEPLPGYTGEFKTLYLLPHYQRRGIGRSLFCRLAALLIECGHQAALAWVLAANPACGFYEAMGGMLCAEREEEADDGTIVTDLAYGWTDLTTLARQASSIS